MPTKKPKRKLKKQEWRIATDGGETRPIPGKHRTPEQAIAAWCRYRKRSCLPTGSWVETLRGTRRSSQPGTYNPEPLDAAIWEMERRFNHQPTGLNRGGGSFEVNRRKH